MRPVHTFILATLAVSVAPGAFAKTDLLRTSSGSLVHWIDHDITVGIDRGAPSRTVASEGVREALQAAVEAWNEVADLPVRFRVVTAPDPAVRVRFCRGKWTGDLDDLGKAVFTADVRTGVVASATVEINECDRSFLAPEEVEDGRFDLQAVLTHELGHVLGLAHSNDPNALMSFRGGTAGVRTPKADDRAGIGLIYGPVAAMPSPEPLAADRMPTMASERAPIERALQTSDKMPPTKAVAVSSDRVPIERALQTLDKMPPAEAVTAMRVDGRDGMALVIYTCEPTLLPPISPVESDREQRQVTRRTLGSRRHAHPAEH
jgi:predicted Zn-dependent protease